MDTQVVGCILMNGLKNLPFFDKIFPKKSFKLFSISGASTFNSTFSTFLQMMNETMSCKEIRKTLQKRHKNRFESNRIALTAKLDDSYFDVFWKFFTTISQEDAIKRISSQRQVWKQNLSSIHY
jgi:hypothetical protein